MSEKYEVLSKSIEKFTTDFYKIVARDAKDNLICSALSAHVVLSMAAHGAKENTAKQMKNSLYLPDKEILCLKEFQSFIKNLNSVEGVILKIANKIYASNEISIKDEFRELTSTHFHSEAEKLDFSKSDEAALQINAWCCEKTNEKIKEIVAPGDICDGVAVILLNAVYFKGHWMYKFDEKLTKPMTFYLDSNTSVEVPTMYMKEDLCFGVVDDIDAQYVVLPYKNENLMMIIIVPNEVNGLEHIEKKLEKIDLDLVRNLGFPEEVKLYLPKFKIETSIDLNQTLKQLGMTEMFDSKANFTGIASESMVVGKVIQKAFIEVNEEGSEAAAVTGIMMMRCAMVQRTPELHVDKPFLYKIVDKNLGVTLFSGRVHNPAM